MPSAHSATRPPASFYQRHAVTVARALIGQKLVRVVDAERVAGIIVETEAYLGAKDKAAHTFNGRWTRRNASMWLGGGHAYVYFTYGMHYCMNVVAGSPGQPVAVLVRALAPVEGMESMWRRRPRAKRQTDLCSGPARLCQALAIDCSLDGASLMSEHGFFIEQQRLRAYPDNRIATGPRVGVHYAQEWSRTPLRFWLRGDPNVSRAMGSGSVNRRSGSASMAAEASRVESGQSRFRGTLKPDPGTPP